jgi:glycosyltransferase involved in cell wall biosynthesis
MSLAKAVGKSRLLFIARGCRFWASSRLRVYNWLPYLRNAGIDCRLISQFGDRMEHNLRHKALRRLRSTFYVNCKILADAKWADTILIQESLLPKSVLWLLAKAGKRIIYDFSDPVHLSVPSASRIAKARHRYVDLKRFHEVLKIADHVIVENALLARLARQDCPSTVMAGPIDLSRFHVPARRPTLGLKIGWLGSPTTYSQLVPILPLIDKIGEQFSGVSLHLLGARETPQLNHVHVVQHPWSLEKEAEVLPQLDIAVCYLEMNDWTRVRGGSKLLAYMAAGCAIVTSPAGIGDQVIKHNICGLVADSMSDWNDALQRLAENPLLRQQLGIAARHETQVRHSYDAQLPFLIRAIMGDPVSLSRQRQAA